MPSPPGCGMHLSLKLDLSAYSLSRLALTIDTPNFSLYRNMGTISVPATKHVSARPRGHPYATVEQQVTRKAVRGIDKVRMRRTNLTCDLRHPLGRGHRVLVELFSLQCHRRSANGRASSQLIKHSLKSCHQVIVGDDVNDSLGIPTQHFKLA